MKKLFTTLSVALMTSLVHAVPAQPGLWRIVTLADGTKVKVELRGDEHYSYYRSADGTCFRMGDNAKYVKIDQATLQSEMKAARQKGRAKMFAAKGNAPQKVVSYTGEKKGIVILAQFPDVSFAEGHDNALYNRMLNEENFTDATLGFKGSVNDYFKAQSYGQFDMKFDVIGPVTLPNASTYYGADSYNRHDTYVSQMITDAVNKAKSQVSDWSVYDWDNDGYIDEVFVLYAGEGQATGGDANTVWPHMSNLKYYNISVGNNKRLGVYACSNELKKVRYTDGSVAYEEIMGIGTFCHEFSHCMTLPDFYDTDYSGAYGTGSWDPMCSGSYNGNTFVPAGYTSYEKMYCGWLTPTLLKEPQQIDGMKALSESGEAYMVYNDGQNNEMYMLENRQKTGWDAELPGAGMLILHIDYSSYAWTNNSPNDDPDHQRMTIIPADNKASDNSESGDTWPSTTNNSLTNTTTPAATVYNKNTDGSYLMNKFVTNITQNTDGTISFKFSTKESETVEKPEGALFFESFSMCNGTGGNDGLWGGTGVGASGFSADNEGWVSAKKFGANQCAMFGTNTQKANVTTPEIALNGTEMELSMDAAPYTNASTSLTISVVSGDATLGETSFTLTEGQWNKIKTKINGNGSIKLRISGGGRLFLDNVMVAPEGTSGIDGITTEDVDNAPKRIYTIDGQYVGTDMSRLGKGVYVVAGKKIVK